MNFKGLLIRKCHLLAEQRIQYISKKYIKNNDFTILSNTCAAGKIYHILGMRFDSPTINTWISQKDFVKFCLNLKHYLNKPLMFFKKEDRDCPCAMLDDICIVFAHYQTEEEARQKWEERKKRVNFNNLFIITSDGNGVSAAELNSLEKVKAQNIVVITSKKRPEIKNSYYCKSLRKEKSGATHMIVYSKLKGYQSFLDDFDFVKFLNKKS